jgi:hypothetical protein
MLANIMYLVAFETHFFFLAACTTAARVSARSLLAAAALSVSTRKASLLTWLLRSIRSNSAVSLSSSFFASSSIESYSLLISVPLTSSASLFFFFSVPGVEVDEEEHEEEDDVPVGLPKVLESFWYFSLLGLDSRSAFAIGANPFLPPPLIIMSEQPFLIAAFSSASSFKSAV